MNRRAVLLVSIVLLFGRPARAADRTLAAEGDYIDQEKPKKPLAHWRLWHLRNGEYEVVEILAGPTDVVQVFHFDSQFLPTGFSLTIDPNPRLLKGVHSKIPRSYPTIISCRYAPQDLSCETESNGTKSANSIVAQQPYVFVPGDFYALDQIWLMTGLVHLGEHNHSENTTFNVYKTYCALDRAKTNLNALKAWPDARICADKPIQLTHAGQQTASVVGKAQPITEYEVWNAGPEPGSWVFSEVLQVTSQGFVAAIQSKSDPQLGYAISHYKEYEPWLTPR